MGVTFSKFTYILLTISLFLQILFCSSPEYAGGVETTNGVTIAVKKNQILGTAPAGSRIVLCDTLYAEYLLFEPFTRLFMDTTFADESGKFKFDVLSDGFYNLTASNSNADSGTIINNICINRLSSGEIHKSSEYAALGSITGTVFIDNKSAGSALIYIMGTEFSDTTDVQGKYTIEKVPPGIYKITGSFGKVLKPDSILYYLLTININVPENIQTTGVDLNLEKKQF
jgi:hypothetical protein